MKHSSLVAEPSSAILKFQLVPGVQSHPLGYWHFNFSSNHPSFQHGPSERPPLDEIQISNAPPPRNVGIKRLRGVDRSGRRAEKQGTIMMDTDNDTETEDGTLINTMDLCYL